MVYFILDRQSSAIKIGHGLDPQKRLESCQVGNPHPLVMIGVLEGGCMEELMLHRQFSKHRIRGEWFHADQSVLDAIHSMPLKMMSFGEWLARQAGRGDPVGDLADDLDRDQKYHGWKWDGKLESLLSRITACIGRSEARTAAAESWEEYQEFT